ncbi:glycosyltransferase family A protein [Microbacterium thalassium]|uniref:Glycosyltransferase involved in cell wall biosynthesis n=1 Tax=Microbacterium thalassium TaxID=362649 RepID=A0A7X0FMQ4_9MICO|nr:glycosyltransferase family A protein [Microbacterium thalassium]MBB6389890.1 glycosyltransferase involved in cell wall biosynthesis [Microbacterium thalassium]GLK24577.1 hypothetical protein GCM10017607_18950 [Microbacterium thalassium]
MPSRTSFALIIPTHRRPGFVREAVDSALRQHRPFDHIIVVADGEDDPAIAALADAPVDVIGMPRRGVAAARNAGVERATSDWVCFLDDDDLLHPHYLARIAETVDADADVGAMNCWYWTFAADPARGSEITAASLDECLAAAASAEPRLDMNYLEIEGRSFDLLLERLRGSMSTAAVRREVLLRAGGFPEGMTCAEDWTMYVNVARFTEWRIIRERLAFFRDHGGTNTRTGWAANGLIILRAIRSFWEPSTMPTPPHRPLDAYRRDYRFVLTHTLDAAVRSRDFTTYRQALATAASVLPRRTDRLRAMTPRLLRRAAAFIRRTAR